MSIDSVVPSNHLILCHLHLLLTSIFPSIRVFSNESALRIRRPKYWSFSFSTSSSNEYSGLISFRIDWFDLLAVQGTLKSLLQHHSSKASILLVLSLLYGPTLTTTGKTIALARRTFVGKVISLLLKMLFRFVIAFLPRNKHLLISWTNSILLWVSQVDQSVKNLPAVQETWVLSLGWEDPLEEGMATYAIILAWRIPTDRGAW